MPTLDTQLGHGQKLAAGEESDSKGSKFGAKRTLADMAKVSAKEIIKDSDMHGFFHAVVRKGTSEALKAGLVKTGLSDSVSDGIGEQYTVAYELVLAAGARKLNARKLGELLATKGLGIAKIANKQNILSCGISAGYVAVSISKTVGSLLAAEASGGLAGGAVIVEVGGLMADLYQMDADCGISAAAKRQIDKVAETAASAMYNTVMQAIIRGSL